MLYMISSKKVLMLKKGIRKGDPNSGYFTLPGGKLKDYEKGLNSFRGRVNSVIRETVEETGIEPVKPVLRGVILFDNEGRIFDNWKNPDNFLVYVYSTKKYSGKVRKSEEGIPYGVSINKVNEVPSNPGDKKMYEWLNDGRNFIGIIRHKGNEIDGAGTFVDYFD